MRIALVGTGMGSYSGMTREAHAALSRADAILGAERLLGGLDAAEFPGQRIPEAIPAKIATLIGEHPEWDNVAVALSGDVGFYSGARQLADLLAQHEIELVCGVSSPQYFAARLRRPWQNFHLVSAHGKTCDVLAEVLNNREVFFLTGGTVLASTIVDELCAWGLDDASVTVGENLASPDERLVTGTAGQLSGRKFSSLAVVLVENQRTFTRDERSAGIADADFLRGKAPMTKREVRAVALSLLAPRDDAILYDIGAGTGSVAVEMALLARRGRVYAIERDMEACGLLRQNREAFGAYNMQIIPGTAPDALASLPAPDAAFIGGSKGNMKAILSALIDKNPRVRIVASAVTLETLSASVDSMRECGVSTVDVTQISATRTVQRGGYHMFDALNPVFLVSGGGDEA